MDKAQNMVVQFWISLRILVAGTLFGLMYFIVAVMVKKKENLLKLVKGMDNGLLTFLTVVIDNY